MTDAQRYEGAAELLRALGSPVRLALVDLLGDESRCVHELVTALGVPQPLVSQHLRTLRAAGLVTGARVGRETRYRLADEHIAHIVRDAVAHAAEPR
jgi:DNA-binding transcriptional ArsR family regulator